MENAKLELDQERKQNENNYKNKNAINDFLRNIKFGDDNLDEEDVYFNK